MQNNQIQAKTEEIANRLDDSMYPFRMSNELHKELEDAGLVVVVGAGDEDADYEVIFHGAIQRFVDGKNNASMLVDAHGILPDDVELADDDCSDDIIEDALSRKPQAKSITQKLNLDGAENTVVWRFDTSIPHETFWVYKNHVKYCQGIVFALSDTTTF